MGFTENKAKEALKNCDGDVERAVESLSAELGNAGRDDEEPSTSRRFISFDLRLNWDMSKEFPLRAGTKDRDAEAKLRERAAYKRLAKDIPESETDHLDTNLEVEADFVHRYLAFLSS